MPSQKISATEMDEQAPAPAGPQAPKHPARYPGRKYGWLSRWRSYFILDPLVFAYTFVLGVLSLPFGFFESNGRILHRFAHFWSRMIMRTIFCPVKVTGLD